VENKYLASHHDEKMRAQRVTLQQLHLIRLAAWGFKRILTICDSVPVLLTRRIWNLAERYGGVVRQNPEKVAVLPHQGR
jgi:hypothetical protein